MIVIGGCLRTLPRSHVILAKSEVEKMIMRPSSPELDELLEIESLLVELSGESLEEEDSPSLP